MSRREKEPGEVTIPGQHGRKLAHLIEVEQIGTGENRGFHFLIDGEEFPWWISTAGISTTVTDNELPTITVQILAEQVTVNNDWRQQP